MTTDPDARIFVSYARSDGRDCTKKLSNRIEDAGLKVWRDLSDLEGGRGWWEQIQEVLQHPKLEHLVLVMTKGAVKSKYVREEWRLARKEGKNVIPVIGTPDLDMTRLPAWMRAQHFIDTENDEQWQRFLAILKGPWRPRPTRFIFQKPSENFVPREKHLQQIKHALQKSAQDHSEDRNKEPAIVSVIGVTGSGKTELVRASCADPDIQDLFYDGIYWLQFDESPDTKRLAAGMLGEFSKSSSPYEQEETIYAKLSEELTIRNMRMLIVIDNVCHKENLEPFLQGGPNCVRLVTAQRLDVLPIRASIISPVDQMTEDEAVEVLQYGLSAEYKTAEHKTAFARLAKDLGYWPMLLALVNGYAQSAVRARATVDQTLGLIRNILANKGITGFDVQDTKDRTRAIYKALELTLNRLNRTEKSRCTELVIFSEDTDVPITAVKIFWKMTGNLSKYESQDLCQKLYNLSLLSVLDLKANFFRLHSFIRKFLIEKHVKDLPKLHNQVIEAYKTHYKTWSCAYSDPYTQNLSDHAVAARGWETLKSLLLDYDWIRIKFSASTMDRFAGIDQLVKLYGIEPLTDDKSIRAVRHALAISVHILAEDPKQLPAQLVGRLRGCKLSGISDLISAAEGSCEYRWLCPGSASLTPSGGPLRRILDAHKGAIRSIAVTGDGALAVSGGDDGYVRFWDLRWGTKIGEAQDAHQGPIKAIAITSDGSCAISGASDAQLRIWHPKTGKEAQASGEDQQFVGIPTHDVLALAISENGTRAVGVLSDQAIHFWDLTNKQEISASPIVEQDIIASAASEDMVITCYNDQSIFCWSVETMQDSALCESPHGGWITSAVITPNGEHAAFAFSDRKIQLWNVSEGRFVGEWNGHRHLAATAIAISHDGSTVVSSARKTLRVWKSTHAEPATQERDKVAVDSSDDPAAKGEWRQRRIGNPIAVIALTRDGRQAVSGHYDGLIKLWNLEEEPRLGDFHLSRVNSLAMQRGNSSVISASDDNTLKVWSLEDGRLLDTLTEHQDRVRDVKVSSDDKIIASVSDDGTLVVRTFSETGIMHGESIDARLPTNNTKKMFIVQLCEINHYAVCASYNHSLIIFDFTARKKINEIDLHMSNPISALALMALRPCAITGHWSSRCTLVNLESCRIDCSYDFHSDRIEALSLTGDDRRAFVGCRNGTVQVWDLSNNSAESILQTANRVVAIVNDAQGQRAVIASEGQEIIVWNSGIRGDPGLLAGHKDKVTAVDVTPTWKFAVSGSDDRTVRLWDLEAGENVATFYADGAITCVRAVDDHTFVAGGSDGAVHILTYKEPARPARA